MGPRGPTPLPGPPGRRIRTPLDKRKHRCRRNKALPIGQLREGLDSPYFIQQLVVQELHSGRQGAAPRVRQGSLESLLRGRTGRSPGAVRRGLRSRSQD